MRKKTWKWKRNKTLSFLPFYANVISPWGKISNTTKTVRFHQSSLKIIEKTEYHNLCSLRINIFCFARNPLSHSLPTSIPYNIKLHCGRFRRKIASTLLNYLYLFFFLKPHYGTFLKITSHTIDSLFFSCVQNLRRNVHTH